MSLSHIDEASPLRPRLPSHLYLTGYRGTGKSSVAVRLARAIGRPVVDLDGVIEANRGRSIREIFDEGGEALFRDLESEALQTVVQGPPSVIALGGGAILREANRQIINSTGWCVWLDADAETIAQRIAADVSSAQRRPSLTELPAKEEIEHLLTQRQSLYNQVADQKVETAGKSPAEIAAEIMAAMDDGDRSVAKAPNHGKLRDC